jgi:membrane protease YdiL (CAAX protease family)
MPDQPALHPGAGAGFSAFLETVQPIIPILAFLVLLPLLRWLFRGTWQELDKEAAAWRTDLANEGRLDMRPVVALAMCAIILALQEYYGGRPTFDGVIRPLLARLDLTHHRTIRFAKYEELYGFAWWVFARVAGYVAPFALWKLWFREDSILDMGLRARGFFSHWKLYLLFLGIVVLAAFVVSRMSDFGSYYPFYKLSSRSWYDFLSWEAMYYAQFFGLEMFFRGFLLGALRRSFGSGAIFVMAVPYCMIHFGKPFLEANGAVIAGVALGSISMKTKSIYQGFLLHITIAGLMDWLTLWHRHALPTTFWPPG